jgi:phosphoglycolate phosphatase
VPRYRNLIFDFDGTLADSRDDIASAQLWVLHQLGITTVTKEDLYPHIGKSLQQTFASVLPASLHGSIPRAIEMYSEYYPPRSLLTTRLFAGVRETLHRLYTAGACLAIASTKRTSGLVRATRHFHIDECFIQLQGSDDGIFKPDPYVLNLIIDGQGWDRRETVAVGDTEADVLAGNNAGVATCGVTYGSLGSEMGQRCHPDHVIHHFPEIAVVAGVEQASRHSEEREAGTHDEPR